MRNKALLTLGVATALVIPFGAAVAAAQEADNPTSATALVADQDRDQLRDCDLYDSDATPANVGDRDQIRDCDLCDGEADQIRDRDRDQLRDPAIGDMSPIRERAREQEHVMSTGDAGAQSPETSNGLAYGSGAQAGRGGR